MQIPSEQSLETEFLPFNIAKWLNDFWTWTANLPSAAQIALLALNAILLTYMASRLPKKMAWQLPEETRIYPVTIKTFLTILIPGVIILFSRPGHVPAITTLLSFAMEAVIYTAITDYRDRWIPDHVTVPMIMIGLAWHPLCTTPEAISGLITCTFLATAWFAIMSYAKTRQIEFTLFSGGDIFLAGAIGSWMGPAYGGLTLGMATALHAAITPILNVLEKRGKTSLSQKILARLGYDPDTTSLPFAPMLAVAFFTFSIITPDSTIDLSPMIAQLRKTQIASEAAVEYSKEHPEETKAEIKKKLDELNKMH